jgi:hypothetical protein
VELGELVGVGVPNVAEDKKCPFSHDPLKGDEENELGGIGSKLAENMKVAKGICHESRPAGEFRKGSEDPDPRDRKKPVRDVVIEIDGEPIRLNDGSSDPLLYPVTCAAHHLIPAQESLKGHPVLEFMCWNGKDQDFRSGKAKDPQPVESLLWGNVAYNVNGCQNGVWLPGNYAVGGGKGGVKIWAEEGETKKRGPAKNKLWSEKVDLAADDWDSGDDDKEEEKVDAMTRLLNASSPADFMLSGTNYEISELNPSGRTSRRRWTPSRLSSTIAMKTTARKSKTTSTRSTRLTRTCTRNSSTPVRTARKPGNGKKLKMMKWGLPSASLAD